MGKGYLNKSNKVEVKVKLQGYIDRGKAIFQVIIIIITYNNNDINNNKEENFKKSWETFDPVQSGVTSCSVALKDKNNGKCHQQT